jgi:hypothetical protein
MTQVQMAAPSGAGLGGVIQGGFGTYPPASDGSYTVDTRDVIPLLGAGYSYVKQISNSYTLPLAPLAAGIGHVVASGALSNGTVAVSNQPDVMRPVNVEVGTGTTAITAGNIAVTYLGNDGVTGTDNFSADCALSSSTTQGLSRGVDSISSIVVTGLIGGTSPWVRLSTTAGVSVPVGANAIDVTFTREYDAGATIAIGTPQAAIGSIDPTTAPNGTVTYSFAYSFVSPVS